MHLLLIVKDIAGVMFSYAYGNADLNHPEYVLNTNGAPWQNFLEDFNIEFVEHQEL